MYGLQLVEEKKKDEKNSAKKFLLGSNDVLTCATPISLVV